MYFHHWEIVDSALTAPFKVVGYWSMPSTALQENYPQSYEAELKAMPKGYGCGICRICGMGLIHNCLINDAKGVKFVVGHDCVKKTGDSVLISAADKLVKLARAEKKRAEIAATFAKQQALFMAELDEQRAKNNGLTDAEVRMEQVAAAKQQEVDKYTAENDWIISRLSKVGGGFAASMVQSLKEGSLSRARFSPRSLSIMADIYSKTYGRGNSKAYDNASDYFFNNVQG